LRLLIKCPSDCIHGCPRPVEVIEQQHGLAVEGLIANPISIFEQLEPFGVIKHVLEFLGIPDILNEVFE
jgi:hypothetical protein